MMLRSSGKPPLARSPIRLRPRRKPLQPAANSAVRTPPGSLAKSQVPNRSWDVEEPTRLRPEYQAISSELMALAKLVHQEFGTIGNASFDDGGALGGRGSPLFERGRYYDEYCARRNERLKRRKGEADVYEKKPAYGLGVRFESAKKREASKFDSRRKSAVAAAAAAAAATPVRERREAWTPRYSLRSSSKENKKPSSIPMPAMSVEKSVGITERKVRRARIAGVY